MNHEMTSTLKKNNKTAAILLATLAVVLLASIIAVGNGNMAFAKTKSNDGISVPTDVQQKQECETAGGTSPVSASCTAVSTNTITQSGGVLGEEHK